jgi:hypothetical protein
VKKLSELFDVTYGNKFDLNKMTFLPLHGGGVNFVGRSGNNQGVSASVAPLPRVRPFDAGLITVALGGSMLSSFVQQSPFYTAQNVAVLRPVKPMSRAERLFACLCIRKNAFRYRAFGREANRTLRDLRIPEPREFPAWVRSADAGSEGGLEAAAEPGPAELDTSRFGIFRIGDLFDIRKGKRLTKDQRAHGETPFIGALKKNNGLAGFIDRQPIHPANTITVNYNGEGGVAEAFYQPKPFWCSDDVNVLYPKFKLDAALALYFVTIIRRERYRFSFGRKWHSDRMGESQIGLPKALDGQPDLEGMRQFIRSLPFSSQV